MNSTIIAILICTASAGAGGFTAAWKLQAANITELELTNANERISVQRAARVAIERSLTQVSQAQAQAASRAARLTSDNARALQSANSLRDSSSNAVRSAASNAEACGRITSTYDLILSESRDFIQEVASDAGRCHIERQALDSGWPVVDSTRVH